MEEELDQEEYCEEGEDAAERMNVSDLKAKNAIELAEIAEELAVENAGGLRKQDLLFAILKAQTEKRGKVYAEGVLETLPDGFGFLRAPDQNYLAGPDDIYVSPSQIKSLRSAHRATRFPDRSDSPKEGPSATLLSFKRGGGQPRSIPMWPSRHKILLRQPDSALSRRRCFDLEYESQRSFHPGDQP